MSRNTEPCLGPKPATHQLKLAPQAAPIPAAADQTLLQAAALAGIELLASCRNGSCRACMRRLISGQVSYRIEWPGLSREEKLQGFILPCVAHPNSDLVLSDED
jgi:ferredoxin